MSLFHCIRPASTSSLTIGQALKYTESVSPYITALPTWSYSPVIASLTKASMCLAITLPHSVVLCPILWSKNLQPGFKIAPYRLFKLIFLTNCRLSQYSMSASLPSAIQSLSLACICLRSAYQRSSKPGTIPLRSIVKIVPLALSTQGLLLSKIKRQTSAALTTSLVPSCSQSIVSSTVGSPFMTASYSRLPNRPSQAPAKLVPPVILS